RTGIRAVPTRRCSYLVNATGVVDQRVGMVIGVRSVRAIGLYSPSSGTRTGFPKRSTTGERRSLRESSSRTRRRGVESYGSHRSRSEEHTSELQSREKL